MAEIHSKGNFERNLKANLQYETGYVYRYQKTLGIDEEKKLNVFFFWKVLIPAALLMTFSRTTLPLTTNNWRHITI